jgi:hypothetical protein
MSSIQNIYIDTFSSISDQLLILIQINTNNQRITDYARQLVDLLDLYDPSKFSNSENLTIQQWMRSMYTFLFNEGFIIKRFSNTNWHIYRLWVMSKIAVILKNSNYIQFLRNSLVEYIQLSLGVFPSDHVNYGALIDFIHRDSISYQVYTLFGIIQTIHVLEKDSKRINSDNTFTLLWDKDPSLRELAMPGIRFLMPYLNGSKVHVEYINSKISSDKTRSDYGKAYNTRNANYLYRILVEYNYTV